MRYIYSIALIAAISFSCFYAINKKQSTINFNKIYKAPSEGPKARKEWDRKDSLILKLALCQKAFETEN